MIQKHRQDSLDSCELSSRKDISKRLLNLLKPLFENVSLNRLSLAWVVLMVIVERCEDGYPYLAAFLDSDENFMIYRRFGFIHARLLLQKQDELRLMEKELDDMDMRDLLNNTRTIKCRTRDINRTDNPAGKETRQQLLARMEDTVLKYDALLLNAQQLASSNRPPAHDYNSVANFVRYKKPLLQGDDDFIYCKEDLITLRPGREHAWLDRAVEKFIKIFPRSAVKYVFCSKVRLTSSQL